MINMMVEIQITATTISRQNARVIKQMIESQHISLSREGNSSCFTSIQLHMVSSIPLPHKVNIWLLGKEVDDKGNKTEYFYNIRKEEKQHVVHKLLVLLSNKGQKS